MTSLLFSVYLTSVRPAASLGSYKSDVANNIETTAQAAGESHEMHIEALQTSLEGGEEDCLSILGELMTEGEAYLQEGKLAFLFCHLLKMPLNYVGRRVSGRPLLCAQAIHSAL